MFQYVCVCVCVMILLMLFLLSILFFFIAQKALLIKGCLLAQKFLLFTMYVIL